MVIYYLVYMTDCIYKKKLPQCFVENLVVNIRIVNTFYINIPEASQQSKTCISLLIRPMKPRFL